MAERAVPGGSEQSPVDMSRENDMATTQTLSVLIIDRDDIQVDALTDFLTDEGFHTQRLSDGEQVSDEIRKGRVQIAILDVSPPATDALALLERIRRTDSDLVVIATTTTPSVEVAVKSLKLGAFDYLQKPIKRDGLKEVVNAAIREKGLLVHFETRLNQIVGQRIRERRSAEALTLKQVANRTGLSWSLISQIELGKSAASMSTLHKLATALQVKMSYFFDTV